ncbi:MAG: cupin domain-containing protein [Oligoflexales bacterium]
MKPFPKIEDVIEKLNLVPLPEEGGFYNETYRSSLIFKTANGDRCSKTAIYYLLSPTDFSALHRVKHDEIFHFYAGDPVAMLMIDQTGEAKQVSLGNDILSDEFPQMIVPAGVWQGCRIKSPQIGWSLLGTTVSPGFEFIDFELGNRSEIIKAFPHLPKEISDEVIRLTR